MESTHGLVFTQASSHVWSGRPSDAAEYFQRVLEIKEHVLGKDDEQVRVRVELGYR